MTDAAYPSAGLFRDDRDAALSSLLRLAELACVLVILVLMTGAPLGIILKTLGKTSPLLPLQWPLMWAAALGLTLLRPKAVLEGLVAAFPFVALIGWAGLSYAWSLNPSESLIASVSSLAAAIGAAGAAGIFGWRRLIDVMFWMFASLAALSALLALGAPSIGVMQETHPGAWSGLWLEKNATGRAMSIGLILAMARFAHRPDARLSSGFVAALCFGVLILSTSKTALVTAFLGAGLILAVWIVRQGAAVAVAAVYGGLIAAIAAAAGAMVFQEQLLSLIGRDLTFTGRTEIWEAVRWRIAERPLLGNGYEAFWEGDNARLPYNWVVQHAGFRPNNAHSSWLEVQLNLGLIGLLLQAGCMIWAAGLALAGLMRSQAAYWALPFIAVTLTASFFESMLFGPSALNWGLLIMIGARCGLDAVRPQPEP